MPDTILRLDVMGEHGQRREVVVDASRVPAVIGRSPLADVELASPSVSRRHAAIDRTEAGGWSISDLGSRVGTFVNGRRVGREPATPLGPGDQVRIGPVMVLVRHPTPTGRTQVFFEPPPAAQGPATLVPSAELRGIAQQRLELLMHAAARFSEAEDRAALAAAMASAAAHGSGCPRAYVVGFGADDAIDVVSSIGVGSGPPEISRSLVALAREGRIAQLGIGSAPTPGVPTPSIIGFGIRSALCSPVIVDDAVELLLYVDARGREQSIEPDAAAFCEALVTLAGMALAGLRRRDLERRQELLEQDLRLARRAQELIMPDASGTVGPVRYRVAAEPGRYVAGDLFDVIALDDDRVAVVLGDVAGKGVGAALHMASVQTWVRATVGRGLTPEAVVDDVNRFICSRVEDGAFITLWLGIIDRNTSTLRVVDAGHGHWCVAAVGAPATTLEMPRNIPIGIEPSIGYQGGTVPFGPGARVVLYSDGLLEQPDADGIQLGAERILEMLNETTGVDDCVDVLHAAVTAHADGRDLADDLTIACVQHMAAE